MKKKLFSITVLLAVLLAAGIGLTGCDDGSSDDGGGTDGGSSGTATTLSGTVTADDYGTVSFYRRGVENLVITSGIPGFAYFTINDLYNVNNYGNDYKKHITGLTPKAVYNWTAAASVGIKTMSAHAPAQGLVWIEAK